MRQHFPGRQLETDVMYESLLTRRHKGTSQSSEGWWEIISYIVSVT